MPREARIIGKGESFYHVITRIVEKTYRFTPQENQRNVSLLRCVEEFSCVQVVTYCFMSNHVHILLRVPERHPISNTVLLDKIEALYGTKNRLALEGRWKAFEESGRKQEVEAERARFRKRMFSLGEFMKTLKQRLTMSYNFRHDRAGTLWEERFMSILLEPTERVLSAVAAYIDLNPMRAKMVSDPAGYSFSGYGEACRGDLKARAGLCMIYRKEGVVPGWDEIVTSYRKCLIWKALHPEQRAQLTEEDMQRILDNEGPLTLAEILSFRNPFFTHGCAFGGAIFREEARIRREKPPPDGPAPEKNLTS